MKMYSIKNVDKFFAEIDKCEGKVELVTDTVLYNLKSKMSQIVASAKAFSGDVVNELELKFSNDAY